jgi:hypothetical protein
MIIRLILILTILALVLGGVGAAFVQAQSTETVPASSPLPAETPHPAKTPHATTALVTKDARHDDVHSQQDAVEVNDDGNDDLQGPDDYSVASAPSATSAPSVASTPSVASAPSAASTPSAASSDR